MIPRWSTPCEGLQKNNPPTIAECLRFMELHRMLPNIREHSLVVARVAEIISHGLPAVAGTRPSPELVVAGALLHDIGKTACLNTPLDHARKGMEICLALGYPEVAEIVAEHVWLRNYSSSRPPSEKVIVNYADKRVLHDRVVGLDERFDYILERYGRRDPGREAAIRQALRRCRQIETDLFSRLDFSPHDLPHRLLTDGQVISA